MIKLAGPVVILVAGLLWTTTADAAFQCAREGGFCRAPFGAVIGYGARGRYTTRRSGPGGLPCNNGVFGDPTPGLPKHCVLY